MARPLADYRSTFDKIVKDMGLNRTVQASAPEIAALTGEAVGRVTRVLDVMKRAGAINFEFRSTKDGRKPYYTIVDGDFASVERRMAEKGIAWSSYQEQNTSPAAAPKPQNGSVKSLAEISPLRKSEPRAEIEVARKYRDQQAFIAQQRKMFEEMGLQLPEIPDTLDAQRKIELEALVRVLPYIESVERSNANLEEQNKTIRAPMGELNDLRAKTRQQGEHIERLVAEKAAIKDDVQRVLNEHKEEVKGYRAQIERLEAEVRAARGNKAINGAIAVTAVKEAVAPR